MPEPAARADINADHVRYLYVRRGLSTYQIAALLGENRRWVTQVLDKAGVHRPPRGLGRARPHTRWHGPTNIADQLFDLYVLQHLTSDQVGLRLGISGRSVRLRLLEHGIPMRTKGGTNREDRRVLDVAAVQHLYLGDGQSAQAVANALGSSRHAVLRVAHERGWQVPLGGPAPSRGPTEIELLEALYADVQVGRTLKQFGIPQVDPGGPIYERFPTPVRLSASGLRALYLRCGLSVPQIELLTGNPRATLTKRLHRAGVALREPGGRSPFMRRWRAQLTDAEQRRSRT